MMQPRITGPYSARPTEPEIPNQRKFDDVAAHKGQRHVLLVFAPSPAWSQYKQFMQELGANEEDLSPRNLAVLISLDTGRAPRAWNYLPGTQGVKARHRFKIGTNDFAIVLLGLDGRIKKQWNKAIDYEEMLTAL